MSGSSSILDRIANPTSINPLDAYSKALTVNNALNDNKLFQARQAAGQAFLNSVNPDGTTNQTALLTGLKADPTTALAAQQAAQSGQTLNSDEWAQQMKRQNTVSSAFMQLLAENNGTAPYDQVRGLYDDMVRRGVLTPADEAKMMPGFGPDAAQNASVGRQRVMGTIQGQEAMTRGMPQVTLQNMGNRYQPVDTNVNTNPGLASKTYTPGLSPGEQASQVQGPTNPDGTPTAETLEQRLRRQGQGNIANPGTSRDGAPPGTTRDGAPPGTTTSPLGTGGFPSDLRNPKTTTSTPAPASQAVPVGQSPAQAEAQRVTAGDSAKAFADMPNQAVAAQTRAAALDNMLTDTSQFTTGPMTDRITKLKALAQKAGFDVNTEGLTAAESFNKLAAQLAQAQNPGSDARLNVSQAANPHSDLSPGGVDLMLRQLRGNEDYIMARSKLASDYPDKGNFAKFQTDIGSNLDPRVFQYSRMTSPQAGTFLNNMKDADQFKKNYRWAERHGLVGGSS